jgi:membrane protein DedA with SNARE-associated domain
MAERFLEFLRQFLDAYGYWTLVVVLLLENAGIPAPGEITLLFVSFLAWSERELHLGYIILVGIAACTVGDNLGYAIGYRGGRPLLDRYQRFLHIRAHNIARGERLFERYGSVTIFLARFIFGIRIVAGPLAGVLRMPWKKFLLFNFLGASVWVSVISLVGYFFGSRWDRLIHWMKRFNIAIAVVAVLVFVLGWWWRRRKRTDAGEED